jgi:hypothetical protein
MRQNTQMEWTEVMGLLHVDLSHIHSQTYVGKVPHKQMASSKVPYIDPDDGGT